jgi:hypothetical protein
MLAGIIYMLDRLDFAVCLRGHAPEQGKGLPSWRRPTCLSIHENWCPLFFSGADIDGATVYVRYGPTTDSRYAFVPPSTVRFAPVI